MAENRLMKDGLDRNALKRIANSISAVDPAFQQKEFIQSASRGLKDLELKQRVQHVLHTLHNFLPDNFVEAAAILNQLPEHWDHGNKEDSLSGFAAWPVIDYVALYGLDYPAESLAVLKRLTPLFTSEFAIRPFLKTHYEETYETIGQWLSDENEHVRRLISEGTRPRLPWGEQLGSFIDDPKPVVRLLEKLKDDPSEYVRRSVANNLNDIAKDHPKLVISVCKKWRKDANNNRLWVIKHACRSLVKSGQPEVFRLLGYSDNPKVNIKNFRLQKKNIKIGDQLEFFLDLTSNSRQQQKIVLDYAIHFVKSNGSLSPKVFKFKNLTINHGDQLNLSKKHSIKPITTRSYYPGKHKIELLINGVAQTSIEFTIKK